jgi:hypothetical protein
MMEKTITDFGYDRDFGGWFPNWDEVKFNVSLADVPQPNGTVQKQWIIEHNLDYYDLVFLGENALGIDPKEITGLMIIKVCLCASWDDCSFWWSSTLPQLVRGAEQVIEEQEEEDEDESME